MGFLNPFLYEFSSFFTTDITTGNNRCLEQSGCSCCSEGYYASTGWDPVSGLGVVDFELFSAKALLVQSPYPSQSPTLAPTMKPTPATQYVLFNSYIEQTCYGDVDLQVGYLTNTCIPNGNSSIIVSCTSQNITFQEFSTSDCFGEFNTSTTDTNNCMKGNVAGFCKETGSYYDLILMDSGNSNTKLV